jgi:predicted nucleic acid-binding protein
MIKKRMLTHSMVIGELSCGNFKKRSEFLGNLKMVPRAEEVTFEEAIELIEFEHLAGKGLGFVDVLILASAILSDAGLFTFDHAMAASAKKLGIAVL